MISYIPRISVIVICYNQQHLIGRALDSILCQKEYVHEIIVSDDCSIDNTWEILKEYQLLFPEIIKLYRNKKNLGVYGNYFAVNNKVTGDLIFRLAGDDVFCDRLFENSLKALPDKKIDFKQDQFIILFDFIVIDKSGNKRIISNSQVIKHNSLSLKIRNLISNRPLGESFAQFKKRYRVKGIEGTVSPTQEGIIDIQPHFFAADCYYFPYVGSVYFADIGISTKLNTRERLVQYIDFCDNVIAEFPSLKPSDIRYMIYRKTKYKFLAYPSLINYFSYFSNLIISVELCYGIRFFKREYLNFLKSIVNIRSI